MREQTKTVMKSRVEKIVEAIGEFAMDDKLPAVIRLDELDSLSDHIEFHISGLQNQILKEIKE